jgi:TP901-1 family phage major tail protein
MAVKTAGVLHSNAIGIYVLNGANNYEAVAYSTSGSLELSRETIDATTKDNDGAKTIILGGEGWSMSCDGVVNYSALDQDGTANTDVHTTIDLFDAWKNKTELTLAWTTGESDGSNADNMYTGNAFISSYSESAGVNDVATYSCSFESNGDITKTAIVNGTDTFNELG